MELILKVKLTQSKTNKVIEAVLANGGEICGVEQAGEITPARSTSEPPLLRRI